MNSIIFDRFFDNLDSQSILITAGRLVEDFAWLSGLLLVVCMMVRLLQEKINSIKAQPDYAGVVVTIVLVTVGLILYNGICIIFLKSLGALKLWIGDYGNYGILLEKMRMFADLIELKADEANLDATSIMGWTDFSFNLFFTNYVVYPSTLFFVSFLAVLWRILQALFIGVAMVWGMIAIPCALITSLSWHKGWSKLLIFTLLWLLIESILLALALSPFISSFKESHLILTSVELTASLQGDAYWLLALSNMVIASIIFMAPILTNLLINNQTYSSMLGAPFAATAGLAGSMMWRAATKPARMVGKGLENSVMRAGGAIKDNFFSGTGKAGQKTGQILKKLPGKIQEKVSKKRQPSLKTPQKNSPVDTNPSTVKNRAKDTSRATKDTVTENTQKQSNKSSASSAQAKRRAYFANKGQSSKRKRLGINRKKKSPSKGR